MNLSKPLMTCVLLLILASALAIHAEDLPSLTVQSEDLRIEQIGSGRDVIFIPGLNSHADVFKDVCQQLQPGVRCHLVQLPGFAGAPPMATVIDGFLHPVSKQLKHYIHSQAMTKPVFVGHSLGGFLSLMLASRNSDLPAALVIVDALPYLPAAQNSAATVEQMQPMATAMKQNMLSVSDQQFQQRIPMQLMGMTRNPERLAVLTQWSKDTDRATMAQALYDMQMMDLRREVANIKVPVLVLGAWAAYESYGSTKAMTQQLYEYQYNQLPQARVVLSDQGFHFLMWDDESWLIDQTREFLNAL